MVTLFAVSSPVVAQDITLSQPIDCVLGESCHIQNYVDSDPGPGAQSFTCAALTYDGHKGTDFALTSSREINQGVLVTAAAPGVVIATRDGEPDISQTDASAPDVSGKECGNGIVIAHEDGWESQYCHMREGSISVEPGEHVENGTPLGQVGLSGNTEFPHLHFQLRQNGELVDPFNAEDAPCGAPSQSLWSADIATPDVGLIAVGFSDHIPKFDVIKEGDAALSTLAPDDSALVLWGYAFGGVPGDEMRFELIFEDGAAIVSETVILERSQAQFFRAVGRRAPTDGWPSGEYLGRIEILRDGAIISSGQSSVIVQD